jgi:pectinesterase
VKVKLSAILFFFISQFFCAVSAYAQKPVVVSLDGKGDYKTIQGAINSLSDSAASPRTIYIKNGVYREKVYLEKANIILEGESRDKTILVYSIARDEWRCGHTDDWGVATLNVGSNDITLKNMTVTNDFGFNYTEKTIWCASDSTTPDKMKKLRKDGHQMAVRTMNMATRMKAINCKFTAFGGDTMSPWEIYNGMWYFKDCVFEGGVDFYCPRGWAWAENCEFISHTGPAAIWHDGSGNQDSKSVLVNCTFKGYDGFYLGRYHRDAQIYLIGCSFAANMRDTAIYIVPTKNTIQWGHRIYYYNCHKQGGNEYKWYANNLPESVKPQDISVNWVFGNRWNPEKN